MIRISFSLSTKVGNLSYICILLPIFYSRCASGRVFGRTPVFVERGQLRRFLFKRNAGYFVNGVHFISKTTSVKSMSWCSLFTTRKCQIPTIIVQCREVRYNYYIFSTNFMLLNNSVEVFRETKISFGRNG